MELGRISGLESKSSGGWSNIRGGRMEGEKICVIGGYGSRAKEDALGHVRKNLNNVKGFRDVSGTGGVPKVVFAEFKSNGIVFAFLRA